MTTRRHTVPIVLAMVSALAGCAAMHRNEARYEGTLLSAAGFDIEPAESPAELDALHALPPLAPVSRTGRYDVEYRIADPYVCRCTYVGDRRTYVEYRRLVSEDLLDKLLLIPLD